MKILFLSNGNSPDYMADVVLHGLKSLLGDDVVDVNRAWYMYADSFNDGKADIKKLYGMGMTIFGLLPPDCGCDRTDIIKKLQTKVFDLVIYGSIQRCQHFYGGVTSVYPRNQVAAIDGEDSPTTFALQDKVVMFKRELCGTLDGFYPIHFGIPEEKILTEAPIKTRFMAEYDPLVNRDYIYKTEEAYYKNYEVSYFAPTMRKMGYDCMRHYEILANWTLPYFRAVEGVPDTVMFRYPKKECNIIRQLIEYGPVGCDTAIDFYYKIIDSVMETLRTKLTTTAVAQYVLDTMLALK